jgi:hypothetical protein
MGCRNGEVRATQRGSMTPQINLLSKPAVAAAAKEGCNDG